MPSSEYCPVPLPVRAGQGDAAHHGAAVGIGDGRCAVAVVDKGSRQIDRCGVQSASVVPNEGSAATSTSAALGVSDDRG